MSEKLVESEAELVKNNSFNVCPVSSLLRTLSSLNIALHANNKLIAINDKSGFNQAV